MKGLYVQTARVLGAIFCGLCGLVVLANIGIGMSYHPDLMPRYVMFGGLAIGFLLMTGLLLFQEFKEPLGLFLGGVTLFLGVGLFLSGPYLVVKDSGDALLWASIPLFGLCLLIVGFDRISNRGCNVER